MEMSNTKALATILPSHELTTKQHKAFRAGLEAFLKASAKNLVGEGTQVLVTVTDGGDYVVAFE